MSAPIKGVTTEYLIHYLDPEDDDAFYKYTLCRRIMPVSPERQLYKFHEPKPSTCLWCAAGRLYSTDVGF
jgi:hypothetical protein